VGTHRYSRTPAPIEPPHTTNPKWHFYGKPITRPPGRSRDRASSQALPLRGPWPLLRLLWPAGSLSFTAPRTQKSGLISTRANSITGWGFAGARGSLWKTKRNSAASAEGHTAYGPGPTQYHLGTPGSADEKKKRLYARYAGGLCRLPGACRRHKSHRAKKSWEALELKWSCVTTYAHHLHCRATNGPQAARGLAADRHSQ